MKQIKASTGILCGAFVCAAVVAVYAVVGVSTSGTTRAARLATERLSADFPAVLSNQALTEPLVPPPSVDSSLTELAAWIRPRHCDETWFRIDWLAELGEAQRLAKQCNRLVFLWGSNDPCGRC